MESDLLKNRALLESEKHLAGNYGGFSFAGQTPDGVTALDPLPRGIEFPNGARSAILVTFDVEANYGNGKGDPLREVQNYERICDAFSRNKITGTFNIVGQMAEEMGPGFVKKMAETGNEIASHGYIHEMNQRYGGDRVYTGHYGRRENFEQIHDGAQALNKIIPGSVKGIRLPYAHWNEFSYEVMEEMGLQWASHVGIDDFICPGQGFGGQPFLMKMGERTFPLVEIPVDTQTFDWAIWMADEKNNAPFIQAVRSYCERYQIPFERTPAGALKIWRSRIQVAIQEQAVFTLLCHPINFTVKSDQWGDPVDEFMLPMVDELGALHREGKVWVCQSTALANFYLEWRAKSKR